MTLKDRVRRLERDAQGNRDYLDLRDGGRFYFKPMDAFIALYLRQMDALRGIYVEDLSEGTDETKTPPSAETQSPALTRSRALFEVLARATPESLRRFERRYGTAERGGAVLDNDGTVTIRTISVDGSATTRVLEGYEAQEYRDSVRAGRSQSRTMQMDEGLKEAKSE